MNKRRDERMSKLQEAGISTGQFLSLALPAGLQPGAKIHLAIDENGSPVIMNVDTYKGTIHKPEVPEYHPVTDQVIKDGYVRNTKLHRRWVMAQMFRALNYGIGRYGKCNEGYNEYVNHYYSYEYQFSMMAEEIRVLGKLEQRDWETFKERSHFFTKEVVINTCEDYINKLIKHVNSLPTKKCKGIPYKRIGCSDIFEVDLEKKLYAPLRARIRLMNNTYNYNQLYQRLQQFRVNMVKLPYDIPKASAWKDAFKGAGSYYTLKNLLMYHDCFIENRYGLKLYGYNAVKFIEAHLDEYQGEGWRYFAMMKKVIKDNKFDYQKRMEEVMSEKCYRKYF